MSDRGAQEILSRKRKTQIQIFLQPITDKARFEGVVLFWRISTALLLQFGGGHGQWMHLCRMCGGLGEAQRTRN